MPSQAPFGCFSVGTDLQDPSLGVAPQPPDPFLSFPPTDLTHGNVSADPYTSIVNKNTNGTDFPDIPLYPDDVATAPLVRIKLRKLLTNDAEEKNKLWKACCELGFFCLDLRTEKRARSGANALDVGTGVDVDGDRLLKDADMLFGVETQFFDLPVEEKVKYDFASEGSYFGYKGYGAGVIDRNGTKDRNEFYNISKDDVLAQQPPLPAPSFLTPYRPLVASFIRASHALTTLILSVLNAKLDLPHNSLQKLHRLDKTSGDQVRFIRAPPQPQDDQRVTLGEHTDFGSITVLFNRVAGLQVLLPSHMRLAPSSYSRGDSRKSLDPLIGSRDEEAERWAYVKPLPGHAIVNVGDALSKFTAGVLRSNIHRVAPPPGKQARCTRYSLVYFARPEDEVWLKALEGSDMIKQSAKEKGRSDEDEGGGETANDWILRRALGRRTGGRWEDSQGTEDISRRK